MKFVPQEFTYRNPNGGRTIFRAKRIGWNTYKVTEESGEKSGLHNGSTTYTVDAIQHYLENNAWEVVSIIPSAVVDYNSNDEFSASIRLKDKVYSVSTLEEACKLIGNMRAMLRLERQIDAKRVS